MRVFLLVVMIAGGLWAESFKIDDILLVHNKEYKDDYGYFFRILTKKDFNTVGITKEGLKRKKLSSKEREKSKIYINLKSLPKNINKKTKKYFFKNS